MTSKIRSRDFSRRKVLCVRGRFRALEDICSGGVEGLEMECRCRELSSYRAGVLQRFMANALAICSRWLYEKVVLEESILAVLLRVICFGTLVSFFYLTALIFYSPNLYNL